MYYKLLIIIFYLTIGLVENALGLEGNDVQVKLQGTYEFQSGFYNHKLKPIFANLSRHNKDIVFNSSATIATDVNYIVDECTNYGAKLALHTATKSSRLASSGLYFVSNLGKVELGSEKSATNKMKITGYSVGVGTTGSWDGWTFLTTETEKIDYVVNFANFLDSKMRQSGESEYTRKISYFTPKFHGLQLGISYIPDASNLGNNNLENPVYHEVAKPLKQRFSVNNAFGYGVSWENNIAPDLKFSTSLVGEIGKVQHPSDSKLLNEKVKNLRSYTVGAMVDYQKYSIAASYGDYLRSFTTKNELIGRDTNLYSVGMRYKYAPFTSSVHYFASNYKKSKFQAITLATDYQIAKGIMSYVEVTQYFTNGKFLDNKQQKQKDKTQGKLLILGGKIYF